MAYEKQNFLDGQIVTADHLNHMENGIIAAQNPRNLLDNSDFTNPVNQRGATSYTGTGYSIDRWTGIGPSVNVSLGSGMTVTDSDGNQYGQYLSDEAWIRLKGKPFTFALCTSDGAVHIATGTMTSGSELYDSPQITIGSTAFKMNLYKDANARPMVRIFALSESTITILWAALYEGVYTADTLPPYVPKGYGAELTECRRYYQTRDISNYKVVALGEELFFSIEHPDMRIAPSITIINPIANENNSIANLASGGKYATEIRTITKDRSLVYVQTGVSGKTYGVSFTASADL